MMLTKRKSIEPRGASGEKRIRSTVASFFVSVTIRLAKAVILPSLRSTATGWERM